jgi:hypothetical protein
VACNDFIPTACIRNMTGEGDLARYNLIVGGDMVATGLIARILEEDEH